MDSVLKKAVEEGIQQYLSQTKRPIENETSSTGFSKKKRQESRLGNLLTKIRSGNKKGESSKSGTVKHIHIKWHRYNAIKNQYKIVKASEGGGTRFLEVKQNEPISFQEMQTRAVELFFDEHGCNYFLEHHSQCDFVLCSPTGVQIESDKNFWDYLEEKGLYISKTYLILKSQDSDFQVEDSFLEDTPPKEELNGKSSLNEPQEDIQNMDAEVDFSQQICPGCSCTMDSKLFLFYSYFTHK